MKYQLLLKNEWSCLEATDSSSYEDCLFMAFSFMRSLRHLEKENKVFFDFTGAKSDHVWVYTNDSAIADDFGFYEVTENNENEERKISEEKPN